MSQADCEGVAAHILERGGWCTPIDPWVVIDAFRVRVEWGEPGERPHWEVRAERYVIVLDPTERPERLALTALHELAHLLLDAKGLPNDEDHAWWLSTALLLPRDEILRALRRGATVEDLVAQHTHASHEAVARRIVQLKPSRILWVWDVQPEDRAPYRVLSPGWRWRRTSPTATEWEAMRAALDELGPVELVGGVRAWAAVDLPWVRILCLSDAEVLLPEVTSVDYLFS